MLTTIDADAHTQMLPPQLPAAGEHLPEPGRRLARGRRVQPGSRAGATSEEAVLVERVRRGDQAACEQLVRQAGGAMLAVARRLLRNEEDARDAVQEAFIQAFRSIHLFRADARLSTWLHRIAMNAALMRLRSASRRDETSIDELLPSFDPDGRHASAVRSLPPGAEAALERAEVQARVRACIDRLPDANRAVIVLRDFEDLSTSEAAATLGVTETAVKVRLHRARQALRTLLVADLGEDVHRGASHADA